MSDNSQDDQLLIARAQKGDRVAFDELIKKHERRAYQYAFRLTSSQEEAMDIVAEAFIRVYNALQNFRGQSAFTTWLYRIVTNCYLDLKKKDKSKSQVSLDAPTDFEGEMERQIEDPNLTPDEEVEKNERERLVQRAVAKLPDYQRAMLMMYHVEMLSYEEIAQSLDLPLGTVKSRLNRARLSLRELLTKDSELFQLG
ncbi:MAG: sigma-70 family RNA polymerase sigma factor [Armatimonadetes bacterium]|nr:sigma-70 family RNA polymerase sigma factor [Armatimonadota bacterium]